MSKINSMMDIGRRSMMNSQTALQTVGHNIANKSTEGYSRQRVEIQANDPVGFGKLRIGTGSKTAKVTRINNPYLEKQIGNERNKLGFYQGKSDALVRVEQVYNEQINKGLNTTLSEFFNAFRDFAVSPESLAARTQVREAAIGLARDFKRVSHQLGEIQNDIDQQVKTHVYEINELTREIAQLNEKIRTLEIGGGVANDERDRRELLIKQLGDKINIRWAEGADGMVTITAGNTALLVTGFDAKELDAVATPARGPKGNANFDIIYKNSPSAAPVVVTHEITGGRIGGLLEVRDQTINELHDKLNQLAIRVAETVNNVHRQGFDAYDSEAGDFFEIDPASDHPAETLMVADVIVKDAGRIAAGARPFAPGDNTIANRISQLQFEQVMDGGTATFDEFYNSMVGQVGVITRRAASAHESQSDIVKQLNNIRESISGVSLDEEATKLIEFQKAFDASARLIRAADEMLDTVLNIKR